MKRLARTTRHGFTLLELVLVVAILAIIMSMTVPRFVNQGGRNLQLAGDQVADLLTMYAQRESLGRKPVGLLHDADRDWLVLLVVDGDGTVASSGRWIEDRTVAPVKLPRQVELSDVIADGESIDISSWPLTHTPGQDRPAIQIVLATHDQVRTIVLDTYAVAPYQLGNDDEGIAADRYPNDLDRAGLGREDW